MKLVSSVVAITALFATLPAVAAEYKIDPMHTDARFTVDHWGTSSNVGGFYDINGTVKFDAKAKTGFVDVRIPVKNINTGRSAFNEHLQGAEFFNVAKYPSIRFVSDAWRFNAQGKVAEVAGQLTLLGQTHPVTLKASKFNCYNSPMLKAEVCGGDFEATIDRTQWGMSQYVNYMPASRYVKLNIQIEAVKQ
ncbi:YceI family protein [Snodgrassella sp. CFCC 13594]|uniref:YceI family protein n=1 Tax=Snodgrassella sp. CFCC 13594 TaxID=1775559 RepID=UPI00082B820C|nr:YceI family protein [Snodgrassella sp. CFCC 13594]